MGESEVITNVSGELHLFPNHNFLPSPKPSQRSYDGLHELRFKAKPHGVINSGIKAYKATQNSLKNIGEFYTRLYSALFNYERDAIYGPVLNIKVGKENVKFNPDILIDNLSGSHYVEAKAANMNNSSVRIGQSQMNNYSWALLNAIERGETLPEITFGIFRYGHYSKPLKLYSQKSDDAMQTLARETKDLLVLPFNLMLLLTSLYFPETSVRVDVKDQKYFYFKSKALNALHEMSDFDRRFFFEQPAKRGDSRILDNRLEMMQLEEAKVIARKKSLCLDDLVVRKTTSRQLREIHYNGTDLADFPVTIYSLRDPEKWIASFSKNHGKILKALKLRDLYAEQQKMERNPF